MSLSSVSMSFADGAANPAQGTSSPQQCVPITDCDGDGQDDFDSNRIASHCSDPEEVCVDAGVCRPRSSGACRVDAECEMPKICDRNICKVPAPGVEDGKVGGVAALADVANSIGGGAASTDPCPYGFYKDSANVCVFGCSTDADCGTRSLPNDRRCRLIPNHTICVSHLNICATTSECLLKCTAIYASDSEGNVTSTSYAWKGQGGRHNTCIPKVAPPVCNAEAEGNQIEGLITRY